MTRWRVPAILLGACVVAALAVAATPALDWLEDVERRLTVDGTDPIERPPAKPTSAKASYTRNYPLSTPAATLPACHHEPLDRAATEPPSDLAAPPVPSPRTTDAPYLVATEPPGIAADRAALKDLYRATAGSCWENNERWLSPARLGEWYGVTTDESGRVITVALDGNGLAGRIPETLARLTEMRRLVLRANDLEGPIPPEIGRLTKLEHIDVSDNQLSGDIPAVAIGSLAALDTLNLANNEFSGALAAELVGAAQLASVDITGNYFECVDPALLNQPIWQQAVIKVGPYLVCPEKFLALLVTNPRLVVFEEAGESTTLAVIGIFTDGSEQPLGELATERPTFRSTDPNVATVDAKGLVTAIAHGGVDIEVEYDGVSATTSIIVYAPFVEIPPYDPELVTEVAGGWIIVNRLIVWLDTNEYDGELVAEIAADYEAQVIAEWRNLNAALLEFANVDELAELDVIAGRMDGDDRIAAYEANTLVTTE